MCDFWGVGLSIVMPCMWWCCGHWFVACIYGIMGFGWPRQETLAYASHALSLLIVELPSLQLKRPDVAVSTGQ